MLSARALARQKATLDLIEKAESSDFYRDLNAVFSATRKAGDWAVLHDPKSDDLAARRQKVLDYLNHYELVSIGIRAKILDGGFYRRWMFGAFVRDWNAAADFIQRERWKYYPQVNAWTYRPAAYEAYQALACAWSRDARRLTAEGGRPAGDPASPANAPLPTPRAEAGS